MEPENVGDQESAVSASSLGKWHEMDHLGESIDDSEDDSVAV